jgi:hypothetical protein
MSPEAEKLVREALARVVRQAFNPPPKRHKRSGWAGSPCDVTCQPCAVEQARIALEALEAEAGRAEA